eukprot:TRINITY_DN88162_c1_g1_i1.p1 TRINITY_DN88162_c1_g1~~TRINITY_DN88162_c1_g1_i1.p1  ORF type:complete len:954 (+),score=100.18 TRINITY_DN88162_c1_g1_i1:155-3016(+)
MNKEVQSDLEHMNAMNVQLLYIEQKSIIQSMTEARSFFERVDLMPRIHWKDVDKYKIYSPEIARGDASFVYLAEQGDKKITVKAYASQWMFDNENILENELNSFSKLSTLGLVPHLLRKPLRTRNNIYLAMDFCNCGSLDMYVKKGKPFPTGLVREITQFLAAALLQIHSMGILHREINPRHILVSLNEAGQASYKLTGLHFCKDLGSNKASSFVGTPEYIAPEAALEVPYGHAADIWSFGVTLYELAVGATSLKVDPTFRARVKSGNLPVFPEGNAVPPALHDLICKCLMYDPQKRPTADQILDHPFITGAHLPPVLPPPPQPKAPAPPAEPAPKSSSPPKPKPTKAVKKLDDKTLVAMLSKDFTKYMEYVNETEDHKVKLKCEKRTTLDPYVLKTSAPSNRGGFSEIYFCTHKTTGEEYALKVVKTSKMTDVKIASLLLGEVEIMLELTSCPFAIRIEDYFVYKNDLCLILEYCNGGDLDNFIRKLRRKTKEFPLEELKLIAWNVACGLYEMHKRNMMHRDIKPKNILVIDDKKTGTLIDIKLCDYGLSKKVSEYEELHGSTILGTFDYFAPELYELMEKRMAGDVTDIKYDYKIDVWSYGILLYFALYGKTPMEPPGSKYSVMRQKNIHYPSIKGVPPSYMDLIKKCLTFDPAKRPSFAELLNDPFFTIVVLQPRLKLAPYTQGKLIGNGATKKTKVYECQKDGRNYAMKVIEAGAVEKKRLVGEIDTLAKLKNSDNIIKLYDYFAIGDSVYLILDYYQGGDLEQYITTKENMKVPLTPDQQIHMAYCVLNGIKDIHTHNIIHRDVHPKNILLDLNPDGSIKNAVIGDFGFARVLLDEAAQTMFFTAYKSPEMTFPDLGGVHDAKTDIWSYGMLLYFVIFGVHPEKYPKNHNLVEVLRKGDVKYDETRASASPELVSVMKECLRVKPTDRPAAFELLKNPIFAKYANKCL